MTKVQQGSFKKKMLALAIIAPAMALTACSDDNDSASAPQPTTTTVSGVAYDGYLENAVVCLDLNVSKVCDDGEPTARTTENGQFELAGVTLPQAAHPLALQAVAGETIDQDTGQPVSDSFSYVAPPKSGAISAFSTLVQIEAEKLIATGVSPSESYQQAESEVAVKLGLDPQFELTNFDAIAESGTDTLGQQAANLHLVNQVLTRNFIQLSKLPIFAGVAPGPRVFVTGSTMSDLASQVRSVVDAAVAASGQVAVDLEPVDVNNLLDSVLNDPVLELPPITQNDLDQAIQVQDIAISAINEAAEPDGDATGGTGGTGS